MKSRVLIVAAALVLGLLFATPAAAQGPSVAAPSAIVIEPGTGRVAYAKNADERRPIGSTTKLMTALVVLEDSNLNDVVTVGRYRGAPAESLLTPPLVAGERMTVADLLRGMLLTSANDAAQALAVNTSGSVPAFVKRMNRRAQELGLDNTRFSNPIGLDTGTNYSTARDLAKLAVELRRSRFLAETVDAATMTLESGGRTRRIANRNTLLGRFGWIDGVKTGYTAKAGWCMVASGSKRGVSLIAVELGAASQQARDDVSTALLNYGFSRFERRRVVRRGEEGAQIPIAGRPGATLEVVAARSVRLMLYRGARVRVRPRVPDSVTGPIGTGREIGELVVSVDGRKAATVPLRAAASVPAVGPARKLQDVLLGPWTLLVLGGGLTLGAALTLLRRETRGRPEELPETEPA